MKNYFLILALLCFTAFWSCEKEESSTTTDSLSGTEWVYSETNSEYSVVSTLSFKSNGKMTVTVVIVEDGEAEKESGNGTYSLDNSVVTMKVGEVVNKGIISGNFMSVCEAELYPEGPFAIYKKK